MTRRDYVLLSSAFRRTVDLINDTCSGDVREAAQVGLSLAANTVCSTLLNANPHHFDSLRFLRDAGVEVI